jgi:para-aminobenzoate synthetase/4-amino-4-deoxychorismate lyase
MKSWFPLPAAIYALVEHTPATVLLESSKANTPVSISQLFIAPLRILEAREAADLPALFAEIERATAQGQFAAGFFAYECGQIFEPTAAIGRSFQNQPGSQPLAWFGIYNRSYPFDHAAGIFLNGEPPGLPTADSSAIKDAGEQACEFALGLTEQQFTARIETIHEWIRAGDVYQLNFTFPLRKQFTGSAAALYMKLRARQRVEFGAFLHTEPGRQILCFSPELFFRLEDHGASRRITTRPMKGTARRGRSTAEDRQIADWLRNDPKNLSENVMIVDLIRNDLGRLCTFGSVRVENLFAVERYQTLWQLTSTVTGELRPGVNYEQIFRALFPCGSITGAPKVRAMQLLAQIEDGPRGVYTGAIGYFSRQKTAFNVAIRTLELEQQHGEPVTSAKMGVGGGIVIDSNPAEEFRECQMKAEFLTSPEEPFSLVETMHWEGSYPLLELHLDRLSDSADYFNFPFDRAAVRAALLAAASAFRDDASRKVRLLLDADGVLNIECELLPDAVSAGIARPGRVRIASKRTNPEDRFLFHKTTHRPFYADALKAAKEEGLEDVLFLNTRGEVTEGAISNIVVAHGERWFTPPLECGLLPGVFRRHLLATRPALTEKILYLHDLQCADAIYLCNAVRGLRQVTVHWD